MIQWVTRGISILMVALGLITLLFVGAGLLAPAQSQQPPTQDLPPDLAPVPELPPSQSSGAQAGPSEESLLGPQDETQSIDPSMASQSLAPELGTEPPGFVPVDGYIYSAEGRRDPFKPFGPFSGDLNPVAVQGSEAPPVAENLDPLEMYDLSQLKVVGILWGTKNPRAMVRDPLGKLHVVQKDTRIGRNNGFIAVIREGEIVVVEPYEEAGVPTAATRVMGISQ